MVSIERLGVRREKRGFIFLSIIDFTGKNRHTHTDKNENATRDLAGAATILIPAV